MYDKICNSSGYKSHATSTVLNFSLLTYISTTYMLGNAHSGAFSLLFLLD